MKALISPSEKLQNGLRIAQVEPDKAIFTISEPLFWTDCPDDCTPVDWVFNPENNTCEKLPEIENTPEQNKLIAVDLLQKTDWTVANDVADPLKSNPYLTNQNEFIAYRNEVRNYAIYPIAGNINWPIIPQEIWAKV